MTAAVIALSCTTLVLLGALVGVIAYAVRSNGAALTIALNHAAADREQARAQLQTVLQRLQAPQMAAVQHMEAASEIPSVTMPLTDSEAAQAASPTADLDAAIDEMVRRENTIHGLYPTPA